MRSRIFTVIIEKCYLKSELTGDFTLRSIRSANVTELTGRDVNSEVIITRTGH